MEKGRIVFLNGVTSAGKTSIVEALQARREVFFYVVANDLFQEMVGEAYLREDYWRYLGEAIILMYHSARLFSDMGKNVLIDGILVEREGVSPHYARLREILKGNPWTLWRSTARWTSAGDGTSPGATAMRPSRKNRRRSWPGTSNTACAWTPASFRRRPARMPSCARCLENRTKPE